MESTPKNETQLSHINEAGNPAMVNVGAKKVTARSATARARIALTPEIMALIEGGELKAKKGPVFQTAILAGIMAAKKTGDLIPLCHPLGLDSCDVHISVSAPLEVTILATAKITAKTGVEMEALTAVSVAALTIYDMCKALSHNIVIKDVRLIEKTGGKRDFRLDEA